MTGKIVFPVAAIGGSGDPALRVNGGPWVKRATNFKSGDTLQLRNQMMPLYFCDAAGKGTEWVRVVGGSWKKRWTLFSAGDQLEFRVTSPQPSKVRHVSIHLESRKLVWYVGSQGIDN